MYLAKTEAVNEYIKKKKDNKNQDDSEEDPDDMDLEEAFKGQLLKISLENETAVWAFIEKVCDNALGKYKTSLD